MDPQSLLLQAMREMFSATREGGILLVSIRDYDHLLEARPRTTPVKVTASGDRRRATFQLWDWDEDGRTYDLELFVLNEGPEAWSMRSHKTRYRAIRRSELSALAQEVGFSDPGWLMPHETGFFQPLLLASRSELPMVG